MWPEICLTINDDIVSEIRLIVSSPSSLKLKNIIENYGYPDGYTVSLCPDCSEYGVFLYYPDKGVIFLAGSTWQTRFTSRVPGELNLSPKMKITYAIFRRPMNREEMLKFSFGENADIQLLLKNYRHWNGYGEIPQSIP